MEGYEKTVGIRIELFKSSNFIPMGDPGMVLGSEAIARVKQADVLRSEEMEKWITVSTSTDAG